MIKKRIDLVGYDQTLVIYYISGDISEEIKELPEYFNTDSTAHLPFIEEPYCYTAIVDSMKSNEILYLVINNYKDMTDDKLSDVVLEDIITMFWLVTDKLDLIIDQTNARLQWPFIKYLKNKINDIINETEINDLDKL
jgi:hypothetical protein